ncbi:MAG: BCD family MFS transporter [Chloroflexota bacterium]
MTTTADTFSFRRAVRISTFQIGSAMGDILVTSIWNRILITNFGIPAGPVSLLIALRYLLSPLSLYAGYLTDNRWIMGLRRTPIIWLGRGIMIASLPLLGLSVMRLGQSTTDVWGWLFALISSLMYGTGTLISGSPFLALVRESAPEEKQGVAVGIVETVLIVFFAITGIAFSLWMEVYSQRVFWEMILATMAVGGFFWVFSIVGVEKRQATTDSKAASRKSAAGQQSFRTVLGRIWNDRRTRLFFIFLSLATMAAWMQDAILEPFGGDAFGLEVGQTTRFNSYWQTATVITLIATGIIFRKRPPEEQKGVTGWGLSIMALGMLILAVAGLAHQPHLIELALLVFGGGFGIYTFGGFSLMMVMSPDKNAGAYLGLWSISILVFKGLGTFLGGALRDAFLLGLGLPAPAAYGLIFGIEAILLVTAVLVMSRIDVIGFAREYGRSVSRTDVQIAAAD